jgi:hypothetical protein
VVDEKLLLISNNLEANLKNRKSPANLYGKKYIKNNKMKNLTYSPKYSKFPKNSLKFPPKYPKRIFVFFSS